MIELAADRAQLEQELSAFSALADRVERLATAAIHVERVGAREREFAVALLRNAKGARNAAAAWMMELKNR